MSNKQQPSDETLAFYAKLTGKLEEVILKVLQKTAEEADQLGVGIIVPGQAAGYAIAGALLTITQDPEIPEAPLDAEEKEVFASVGEAMHAAYTQRLIDSAVMLTSFATH